MKWNGDVALMYDEVMDPLQSNYYYNKGIIFKDLGKTLDYLERCEEAIL